MNSTHSTVKENTFKCVYRAKHCAGAVLNQHGKCIADCFINRLNCFDCDCVGITNDTQSYWDGREICLSMRRK